MGGLFTNQVSLMTEQISRRSWLCSLLPFFCLLLFIGSAIIGIDHKEKLSIWGREDTMQNNQSNVCKNQLRPYESESLPKGIISQTSDLEMRPLWGSPNKKNNKYSCMNLLAIAAGVRQMKNVNQIVQKFPSNDFAIMVFHYDGRINDWNELKWYNRAIHVAALNQTKWWFAKRFLHPDIIAEYDYIFLWDEDLGVDNFDPLRYLTIVKEEGLEISQPALDPTKSEVHHEITMRRRGSNVHRRIYKETIGMKCDENSTGPPCTGWVEMMAPVFSKAAWRCAWYMIQNDLVYAWGLDREFGYCAQGDRTKNVGIVDSEYIVHQGLLTLGGSNDSKEISTSHINDDRMLVRLRSYEELAIFEKRWKKAKDEDECWVDPYPRPTNKSRS